MTSDSVTKNRCKGTVQDNSDMLKRTPAITKAEKSTCIKLHAT